MPQENFFNIQLDFTDKEETFKKAQFRWKAINAINGLRYGNGGMSSWTKTYVREMQTHENQTEGDITRIADFCLDSKDNLYWAMHDCYSTTYPNQTPFQAWRAGFREGVKMCLDKGAVPSVDVFKETVAMRNMNNLTIWHNIGLDAENGEWAIMGARMGTYMTMLTDWNHIEVQWFDNYLAMWENVKNEDPLQLIKKYGDDLSAKLGLPMCMHTAEQSKFFKRHYKADARNLGPLVTEMEVIRRIEGW